MRDPETSDEIRQRMAVLRQRMDDEFEEVIENAQVLGDWKYYVRKYPWICLAGAAALGYVVVPQRTNGLPGHTDREETARDSHAAGSQARGSSSDGLGGLKSMAFQMLMRTAVSYAGRKLGEYLTDGLDHGLGSRSSDLPAGRGPEA